MKKILFRVAGGLGKNIMGLTVAKAIRQKYPDAIIHIQASYPDVFMNLDYIDRYFPLAPLPYFYDEHKDFEVMSAEPYMNLRYRNGEIHLIEAWCDELGLETPKVFDGEIVLSDEEVEYGKQFLLQMKLNMPLAAIQIAGGVPTTDPNKAKETFKVKNYRDFPIEIAQEVVNDCVKGGTCAFVHIALPTEKQLQNVIALPNDKVVPLREIFAIINVCDTIVGIDSFVQHAWKALGKKDAIVMWGGTNPVNLGYNENKNLVNKSSCGQLHCNRPNTFMFDFVGNGNYWKCPFGAKCMKFGKERILSEVKETLSNVKKAEPQMCPSGNCPSMPTDIQEPRPVKAEHIPPRKKNVKKNVKKK